MSKSRDFVESKLKLNENNYDAAKWHFHNKGSKKIWATLQWLYRHDCLTDIGKENFEAGYKGTNGILKITKNDVNEDGRKVMDLCYPLIGDSWNKVDTILSRCAKKILK